MSTMVLAEYDFQGGGLAPASASVVTAAKQLPGPTTVLVIGSDEKAADAARQCCQLAGVDKVLLAKSSTVKAVAESFTDVLLKCIKAQGPFTHVLAPASTWGKSIIPRAAAVLDSAPVTDVIDIVDEKTFQRPIYAGNAITTVQIKPVKDTSIFLTVRPTSFDAAPLGDAACDVVDLAEEVIAVTAEEAGKADLVDRQGKVSDRPELGSARVVVSGGRALKSKENFHIIEALADELGAAVGASRAAVDAGYVPNELQVGQTGKVVAPELYIAAGISGAIQHVAGMKDSKTIVAINTDPEAPIHQVADYSLEADLFNAVPELTETLGKIQHK